MLDWFAAFFCFYSGVCGMDACRDVTYTGDDYQVCSYRVADVSVSLFHADKDGKAFGSLSNVKRSLTNRPLMLMNGGIYHEDLAPVGLYVEEGEEKQRISTKGGWGNFHLLPNGVFWVKDGVPQVLATQDYRKKDRGPDFATQSGPMLVINGQLHPRFIEGSDSLKIRNGVGVSEDRRWVHFAISKGAVNFWNFGKLFQEELQTHNALFLDGTVSSLRTVKIRRGGWRQIGPIIGVFEKNRTREPKG